MYMKQINNCIKFVIVKSMKGTVVFYMKTQYVGINCNHLIILLYKNNIFKSFNHTSNVIIFETQKNDLTRILKI